MGALFWLAVAGNGASESWVGGCAHVGRIGDTKKSGARKCQSYPMRGLSKAIFLSNIGPPTYRRNTIIIVYWSSAAVRDAAVTSVGGAERRESGGGEPSD